MDSTIKIYNKNLSAYHEIPGGTTLRDIYENMPEKLSFRPICALVNNKVEPLSYPVYSPKQIEFLPDSSRFGKETYVRTLCMILFHAVRKMFPGKILKIELSISKGYYCRILNSEQHAVDLSLKDIDTLKSKMKDIINADLPIIRKEEPTAEVSALFEKEGLMDKVTLLTTLNHLYTTYYKLEDTVDSYYGALAPSTSYTPVFELEKYKSGFLLLGRDPEDPGIAVPSIVQDKMYHAFTAHLKFNKIIGVSDVGHLNRAVEKRHTADLINVAEALHGKLLGAIADEIAERRRKGEAGIIMIAGPSSSGKTTTCKRLAIQLMTNLIKPKMISLDDYFVDRDRTPRDHTGDYDFESLYALDLDRFNSDLQRLLAGETINLPTYSFELGKRVETERPLRLENEDVLIIEGIHGLNPELTSTIPEKDLYKIYVSALTTLRLDDHNWISTSDNRLLRRIVRDHKYRHIPAQETIRRWPSVRRGEEKWIFPFGEYADATFNSSLIFELGVMKDYAEPLLRAVPHGIEQYAEANRLLRFLDYFKAIPADQIPSTSLLREFLGGSSFHY